MFTRRSIPYMTTVGNHEMDYRGNPGHADPSGEPAWHPQDEPDPEAWGNMNDDSCGECGVPTAARFDGTGNGNGLFWYSFDEGGVHVVFISSENDWRVGSPQYEWLKQDLAGVNRTVTPWIVVNSHRMMYDHRRPKSISARRSSFRLIFAALDGGRRPRFNAAELMTSARHLERLAGTRRSSRKRATTTSRSACGNISNRCSTPTK